MNAHTYSGSPPLDNILGPAVTFDFEGAAYDFRIARITPEIAALLLATQTSNRRLSARWATQLGQRIAAGDFKLTGEPILIDRNGALINGQHRLRGCLESGVEIVAAVISGIDPSAFALMDRPLRRTTGGMLYTVGINNGVAVAATARIINALEIGWSAFVDPPEIGMAEVQSIVAKYPFIEEATTSIKGWLRTSFSGNYRGISNATVVAVYTVIRPCDPDLMDKLFEDVCTGAIADRNSTAWRMRVHMLKGRSGIGEARRELAAVLINGAKRLISGAPYTGAIKGMIESKFPEIPKPKKTATAA